MKSFLFFKKVATTKKMDLSLSTHLVLQSSVTPVTGYLMAFSSLCRHKAYAWHTDINADKIFTYIK